MSRAPTFALAAAAAALVLALGASASSPAAVTSTAWAIKIVVPGQPVAGTPALNAPDDAVSYGGAFAYPADGSVVSASSTTTSVSAAAGAQASAGASSQVSTLSLFKGEIAAAAATGESHALASGASASGDAGVSGIDGLVVLGQPVTPTPDQQVQLGDWGHAVVLAETVLRTGRPAPGYETSVVALDVFVTADHGGLPAGSEVQIGYAEASARASRAAQPTVSSATSTRAAKKPKKAKPVSRPPTVTPKLGQTGYVFPVYGDSSFGGTFGASRPDVPGGWHHGDDIFAALGAPVVAVAHGTVFSVGWERLGGWRLWLRDDHGNEFYYAHLSAYSPFAVNGAVVNAGDVLGFVGDTGDAEGTPYHLHFEIHPVGLLGLGYDGAVDPTSYLDSWRRLVNIRFDAAAGWTPAVLAANAPKAGALLLESTDISSASGLDPASLVRVFSGSR